MTLAEAIDTTRIHSVAGLTGRRTAVVTTRPFRAPHHTISDVGLIGGGQVPMPGEVSLAHHGVLFLDELPECRRHGLEVLRQPLEDGLGTIARAPVSVKYARLAWRIAYFIIFLPASLTQPEQPAGKINQECKTIYQRSCPRMPPVVRSTLFKNLRLLLV
jgi:magnesium chelatase subunit ChlI-like protein